MSTRLQFLRLFGLSATAVLLGIGTPLHAATVVDVDRGTVQGERLFDPAGAAYAAVQVSGHRIGLRRLGTRLELSVSPPDASAYTVLLDPEIAQVRQVRIHGQRLVVFGWMNGSLAVDVSVHDRLTGGAIDRFWSYDATSSPDGRYIAFQKFYPSHFIDQWESHYRLYDVSRDPGANRPALRRSEPGEAGADARVDVGVALYPVSPGELDRDSADATPGTSHALASPFAWSPDSRRLGFVDVQGSAAQLVTVQMPVASPLSLSTRMAPLPELGTLCNEGSSGRSCATLARDHLRLSLSDAAARVTVQRPGASQVEREVSVPASRFAPAVP